MKNWLKYVITMATALLLMLVFRTLAFSIHGVVGDGLAPMFQDGDRLLVNRCSYGVRIEGNRLLPYSRLMRRPVKKGDIVAFIVPSDSVTGLCIARCTAVPGDTLHTTNGIVTVPGLVNCAKSDYYWLESINANNPADSRHLGFIDERNIVGRVVTVLYNTHRFP
jgi:signal peptidase I